MKALILIEKGAYFSFLLFIKYLMLLASLIIINWNLLTISFNGQIFFQKSSTEIFQCLISLHNDIMFLIIVILFFVLWVLWRIIYFYSAKRFSTFITWKISCMYYTLKNLYNLCWNYINKIIYEHTCSLNMPSYEEKMWLENNSVYIRLEVWMEKLFLSNQKETKKLLYAVNSALLDLEQDSTLLGTKITKLLKEDNIRLNFTHHTLLEQVWTLIPTLILFSILLPSLTLIYMMDNIFDNSSERSALITLKIIGNQWYWTYQTSNGCLTESVTFDSYLDNNIGKSAKSLRLLQVDKEVYLPINTKIRLLITSNDVIHSWAIPSCGIKMDAVPGRINSTGLEVTSFGRKIGQCSELCGTGHAFMPIVIRVVSLSEFLQMLLSNFF